MDAVNLRKTSAQVSYNMSQVRSKGSQIERYFEAQLKKNKIKFKRHPVIAGKPDFILPGNKIALFCDSHFWHGYNWIKRKLDHKSNKKFWLKKIERNIARDKEVNQILRKQGWKVFRFWEHQILKNPAKCINKVKRYIHEN